MTALIPADKAQCQAEIPNGENAFTLGGGHKMVRCTNKPAWIATELKPGVDGLIGSMSLCEECKAIFLKQVGEGFASFEAVVP